jgi:cytochrome c oxidase subunit 3
MQQQQISLQNTILTKGEQHPFHLVNPSPWPIFLSLYLLNSIFYLIGFLHESLIHPCPFIYFLHKFSFILFILTVIVWFNDIVLEATFEGHHTLRVQSGLRYGMGLFIVSEILFFFAFFWAFFHSSISPSVFIGNVWPPNGILVLSPWSLPLLNTVILLSSGISITWAHRAIITLSEKDNDDNINNNDTFNIRLHSLTALFITIIYGLMFLYIQRFEYINTFFTIEDGIYATVFYSTTGLHGLHVLVGTIFLIVCFLRHIYYHFTVEHHVGLEAAIWYWHFVDVVWLFLFISIYWWGGK